MTGVHPRNTTGMHGAPRCGAKTRKGTPCRSPAVHGRKRCRMHGGAKGSGAPRGNSNALRTGLHTAEAIALRKHVNRLERESREIMENI